MKPLNSAQLWTLLASALGAMALVYVILFWPKNPDADAWHLAREIDSWPRLLFNGFLGQFFRFKFVGNLHWMALPLLVYLFSKFRHQPREVKALLIFYTAATVIIAIQGYYNSRYQITLYPLSAAFLAWFLYDRIKAVGGQRYLPILAGTALVLVMGNYGLFALENILEAETTQSIEPPKTKNEQEPQPEVQRSPLAIFDTIDSLQLSGSVLVNNLPQFYYYTEQFGVFYWSGDDQLWTPAGHSFLMGDRSFEEVDRFLLDSLGCHYAFHSTLLDDYHPEFTAYLQSRGDTLLHEREFVFLRLDL